MITTFFLIGLVVVTQLFLATPDRSSVMSYCAQADQLFRGNTLPQECRCLMELMGPTAEILGISVQSSLQLRISKYNSKFWKDFESCMGRQTSTANPTTTAKPTTTTKPTTTKEPTTAAKPTTTTQSTTTTKPMTTKEPTTTAKPTTTTKPTFWKDFDSCRSRQTSTANPTTTAKPTTTTKPTTTKEPTTTTKPTTTKKLTTTTKPTTTKELTTTAKPTTTKEPTTTTKPTTTKEPTTTTKPTTTKELTTTATPIVRDCQDVFDFVSKEDGVYDIYPNGVYRVAVKCINATTVTLYEKDPKFRYNENNVDFLGDPYGNYFLGFSILHDLTSLHNYDVLVDIFDKNDQHFTSVYKTVRVASREENYKLTQDDFIPPEGDILKRPNDWALVVQRLVRS